MEAADGRTVRFDLAVLVPRHLGAACIARLPGLGDARAFVPCDPRTLRSKATPDLFRTDGDRPAQRCTGDTVSGPVPGRPDAGTVPHASLRDPSERPAGR